MSKQLRSVDSAPQTLAADAAARQAGVEIRHLDEIDALNEAASVINRVWSTPDSRPLISGSTLRALSHAGNYVFAAYRDSEMVGAIVGWLGFHDGSLHLHSHITGVSPGLQGKQVGFALKQHQRAWALDRGIGLVTWTFDPLVRRNAYFNLMKLGASITQYYASFYGEMNDGINAQDETDRVLIEWDLDSPEAREATVARLPEPDVEALERSGAAVALSIGENDEPVEGAARSDVVLVAVPEDIVELRHRDEGLARRWRLVLRKVLSQTLNDGYVATGMSRSGFYVLQRGA